jgi:hypothetical protein
LREFVFSDGFRAAYDLDDATWETLRRDDEALLEFGYRLQRQVLFGEETIPLRQRPTGDTAER